MSASDEQLEEPERVRKPIDVWLGSFCKASSEVYLEESHRLQRRGNANLLVVDTETIDPAEQAPERRLEHHECLELGDVDINEIQRNEEMHQQLYDATPFEDVQWNGGSAREALRQQPFALAAALLDWDALSRKLEERMSEATAARQASSSNGPIQIVPEVRLFANPHGGTGPVLFLLAAAYIRQEYPEAEIVGVVPLDPIRASGGDHRRKPNAVAFLRELNRLQARTQTDPVWLPGIDNELGRPLLDRLFVLHHKMERGFVVEKSDGLVERTGALAADLDHSELGGLLHAGIKQLQSRTGKIVRREDEPYTRDVGTLGHLRVRSGQTEIHESIVRRAAAEGVNAGFLEDPQPGSVQAAFHPLESVVPGLSTALQAACSGQVPPPWLPDPSEHSRSEYPVRLKRALREHEQEGRDRRQAMKEEVHQSLVGRIDTLRDTARAHVQDRGNLPALAAALERLAQGLRAQAENADEALSTAEDRAEGPLQALKDAKESVLDANGKLLFRKRRVNREIPHLREATVARHRALDRAGALEAIQEAYTKLAEQIDDLRDEVQTRAGRLDMLVDKLEKEATRLEPGDGKASERILAEPRDCERFYAEDNPGPGTLAGEVRDALGVDAWTENPEELGLRAVEAVRPYFETVLSLDFGGFAERKAGDRSLRGFLAEQIERAAPMTVLKEERLGEPPHRVTAVELPRDAADLTDEVPADHIEVGGSSETMRVLTIVYGFPLYATAWWDEYRDAYEELRSAEDAPPVHAFAHLFETPEELKRAVCVAIALGEVEPAAPRGTGTYYLTTADGRRQTKVCDRWDPDGEPAAEALRDDNELREEVQSRIGAWRSNRAREMVRTLRGFLEDPTIPDNAVDTVCREVDAYLRSELADVVQAIGLDSTSTPGSPNGALSEAEQTEATSTSGSDPEG